MRIATAERVTRKPSPAEAVALLYSGARMDREAFHELYGLTPETFKAELIDGEVHVASPVSARHGAPHANLIGWMFIYMSETPDVEVYDNTTSVLDGESETQPDAAMRILEACGGQTRVDADGYIRGAPELVVEVAQSTASIDLGKKKTAYEKAGVREYLVASLKEKTAHWFARRTAGFEPIAATRNGILRSECFPGLWLAERDFFESRIGIFIEKLRRGLASPEHAAFVAELNSRRKKLTAKSKRKPKS